MICLTKFILIGSLVSLGLLAAHCQDFLALFYQDWFAWTFRKKHTTKSGTQSHSSERARRTHSTQSSPEMRVNPFEVPTTRPNSSPTRRKVNPGCRMQ